MLNQLLSRLPLGQAPPEPSSIALLARGMSPLVGRRRASWRATGCHLAARRHTAVLLGLMAVMSVTASAGNLRAAEFIPLGFLPGTVGSKALGVSDDGSIVAGTTLLPGGGDYQAFRWTEAAGMVGLGTLPGRTTSSITIPSKPVSGDGSTIIGSSGPPQTPEAFIYSVADGMRGLGGLGYASSASFDGSVVVGWNISSGAYRWTESGGMVRLVSLSTAYDVSADGSTVVGHGFNGAVVWTAATGSQNLGVDGAAMAISSNGKVVAGRRFGSPSTSLQPWRWDESSGVVGLGWLPGTTDNDPPNFVEVRGINDDGGIIVGSIRSSSQGPVQAFIWTADSGMQDLQQLLIDEYGLASSLAGWSLSTARGISANGRFIVGAGVNPAGAQEGWLVRLESVPEPATLILALCGLVGVVCLRGRHRQGPRPKPLVHPVPR